MIHVIATIKIIPGERENFLEAFRKLIPLVRAETGCLEYGPTIDVATSIDIQEPLRENVVTVVEQWESVQALEAHMIAPHMREYKEKVGAIMESVKIDVLQPV